MLRGGNDQMACDRERPPHCTVCSTPVVVVPNRARCAIGSCDPNNPTELIVPQSESIEVGSRVPKQYCRDLSPADRDLFLINYTINTSMLLLLFLLPVCTLDLCMYGTHTNIHTHPCMHVYLHHLAYRCILFSSSSMIVYNNNNDATTTC